MPVINIKTGKEFQWNKNVPAPNVMCRWHKHSIYGHEVHGSVRHIAHLDRLNNLSKGRFHTEIEVIQPAFNTGVVASVGTHDYDMVADLYIPGVSWWAQQRFFRRNGFACWYRHPPLFGNHIHGFTLPHHVGRIVADDFANRHFKVGKYIDGGYTTDGKMEYTSQLVDYYFHAFGLKDQHRPGSDKSWFPPNIEATVFDLSAYVARRKRIQSAA